MFYDEVAATQERIGAGLSDRTALLGFSLEKEAIIKRSCYPDHEELHGDMEQDTKVCATCAIGRDDVTLSIPLVSTEQLIAAVSVPIHEVNFGEWR